MKTQRLCMVGRVLAVCAVMFVAHVAGAQYASNFEALSGSAGGTVLTGQDGYYIPGGTNSIDFNVYTYSGNALGLPVNPQGGRQFVAAEGPGSPTFGRAQRDIAWPTDTAVVNYDLLSSYNGQPPSANNLGSFSVQPFPGSASYIHLFSWTDPAAATNWQALYLGYDAGGALLAQPGASPGPEWENLSLDHWYRFSTSIDFSTNEVTGASITDLTTGTTTTAPLSGVYLEGGTAGGAGAPTGFRFFAGGGVSGNITAWDNFSVVPEPASALLLCGGLLILRRR